MSSFEKPIYNLRIDRRRIFENAQINAGTIIYPGAGGEPHAHFYPDDEEQPTTQWQKPTPAEAPGNVYTPEDFPNNGNGETIVVDGTLATGDAYPPMDRGAAAAEQQARAAAAREDVLAAFENGDSHPEAKSATPSPASEATPSNAATYPPVSYPSQPTAPPLENPRYPDLARRADAEVLRTAAHSHLPLTPNTVAGLRRGLNKGRRRRG